LGEKGEKDFKIVQMNLEKGLRKEIQKNGKRERGALAGRGLTSGPLAEAGPARLRSLPSPHPRCARAWTAAPCCRGAPAELGRRVASMRQPRRALVGHQERPAASASAPTAICASPLALSPSLSPAQQQQLRRAPSPPTLGAPFPAFSFLPAAITGSASSFRITCSRSIALGESRASGRAHWSELELRRPLGPRGSPPLLRHSLRF